MTLVKTDQFGQLETQEQRNQLSKEIVVLLAQMRRTAEFYLAKNVDRISSTYTGSIF